jgi:hypothetical protein
MSFDSCSAVVSKLYRMSGAFSSVVWFLGPLFTQKTRRALAFFLSLSNRNRSKVFAVLSKKLVKMSSYIF